MQEISTVKEFDTLLRSDLHFLVYKFNPDGCSISARTKPIVEKAQIDYAIDTYRLNVHTAIELKEYIAHVS